MLLDLLLVLEIEQLISLPFRNHTILLVLIVLVQLTAEHACFHFLLEPVLQRPSWPLMLILRWLTVVIKLHEMTVGRMGFINWKSDILHLLVQ